MLKARGLIIFQESKLTRDFTAQCSMFIFYSFFEKAYVIIVFNKTRLVSLFVYRRQSRDSFRMILIIQEYITSTSIPFITLFEKKITDCIFNIHTHSFMHIPLYIDN